MKIKTLGALLLPGFFFGACDSAKNPVTDIQQTANLRNVTLSFSSVSVDASFPEGWQDLEADTSTTRDGVAERFRDPAQYGFSIRLGLNARNREEGAAKFDGLDVNTTPDTSGAESVQLQAAAFEIPGDTSLSVDARQTINLATHRITGLYLLQHMASNAAYQFEHHPTFYAKVGPVDDSWDGPAFDSPPVPPAASPQAQRFAALVLRLGLLD